MQAHNCYRGNRVTEKKTFGQQKYEDDSASFALRVRSFLSFPENKSREWGHTFFGLRRNSNGKNQEAISRNLYPH